MSHASPSGKAGGLASHALRGLVSSFAQTAVQRLVSFGSQLVLASLLMPADFGLIGLAGSIAGIVQAVTDLGIEDVLLRRHRRFDLWSGTALRTMLVLLSAAGLVIAAASPLLASAYHAPALTGLLLVIAVSTPLPALSAISGVRFRAELRFGFLAAWASGETLVAALLTIGFAWRGLGAYSFVLPPAILALARAVLWNLSRRSPVARPTRRRSRRLWRSLVGTSSYTLGAKFCWALLGQGDYAVLGLVAGHAQVGLYWFAFRLAAQPLYVFAGNLASILFPTLVAIGNDRERQGRAALRAARLLSACVIPAAMMQAALAGPLVDRFFARSWSGSVPLIQLLSIGLGFDAVSWIAAALMSARGEFRTLFLRMLVYTPLFLAMVSCGAKLGGAIGTAAAVALYYMTTQPLFVWSVFRTLGVTRRDVAALYLTPLFSGAIAAGTGLAVASSLPHDALLARAALIAVAGLLAYVPLVRTLQPDIWAELADRARPVVAAIAVAARPAWAKVRVRTGSSVAPSAAPSAARR